LRREQRDRLAPRAVAGRRHRSEQRRAIEDRHRQASVGGINRAGDRLRRLFGQAACADDRQRRGDRIERVGDGAAGSGIASRVRRLRGDRLRTLRREQRDRLAPRAVAGRRHRSEQRRAIEDRHRQASVGGINRAGDRLRRLFGQAACADDRQRRGDRIERVGDGAAGSGIASRVRRLRGDRLRTLRREQRDRLAPRAVAGRRHRSEQRRAIEDRHRQAGVRGINRAGDRLRRLAGQDASADDRQRRRDGVERIGDGAAGPGIASRVRRLRGDRLRTLRREQRDRLAPTAVAGRRHRSEQRRTIEDRYRQAGVGGINRAGDRLRRLAGQDARAGDRQRRSHRVDHEAGIIRHTRCELTAKRILNRRAGQDAERGHLQVVDVVARFDRIHKCQSARPRAG